VILRFAILLVASANVFAHGVVPIPEPESHSAIWRTWEFDPLVIFGLATSALLYARGLTRLWRATQIGSGIRRWHAWSFAAGWLATVIALVSPLHPLGQALFSAHMTQHEILMLVSAPLMVLGRPLVVFLWALPTAQARKLCNWTKASWFERSWSFVSNAFAAWLIHLAALWVWHIPALFEATLESDFVHALQHTSFLFSALLFWWAVLHGRRKALGYGLAVLYMFTTALQSGLLGVLLTVSSKIWYPAYGESSLAWGLTPLEDQQLGGLALFAGWLRDSELRVTKDEALKSLAG
jgi:putative membrane protein